MVYNKSVQLCLWSFVFCCDVFTQRKLRKGVDLISSYLAGSDLMYIMEFWREPLTTLEEGEISKGQRDL